MEQSSVVFRTPTLAQSIEETVDWSNRGLSKAVLHIAQKHVMRYRFALLELDKRGYKLSSCGPCDRCGGMMVCVPLAVPKLYGNMLYGQNVQCYDCGWDPNAGGRECVFAYLSRKGPGGSSKGTKRIKAARSGAKTVSRKVAT